MALSEQRKRELDAIARQNGLTKIDPQQERQSVLGSIARDLATPFARAATNVYNFGSGVANLGAAGLSKLSGDDELARQFVQEAGQEAVKVRNVPFLGETAPVLFGDSGNILKDSKDVVGTGLQIGSTIVGGGASKSAAKTGFKTLVKEGVKEGAKIGASTSALYEGGKALSEDKGALDTLQSFILGGTLGAAGGAALGAVTPALGAGFRGAKDVVTETAEKVGSKLPVRNPIPGMVNFLEKTPGTIKSVVGGIKESAVAAKNKTKGLQERVAENTKQKVAARKAYETLLPEEKAAYGLGVQPEHISFLQKSSEPNKQVFRKIGKAAENYLSGNREELPESIAEQYVERLQGLGKSLDTAGKVLDDRIAGLGGAKTEATATINDALEQLSKTRGLENINVNEQGLLDFSRTELSGSNTEKARKELQKLFDDIVKRADDPEALHRYRREIRSSLAGKKGNVELNETEEYAAEAFREGIAKTLDRVSPGYEEASKKVGRLLNAQRQLNKIVGNKNEYSDEIFDRRVATLMRRLTNNTKSGADLAQAIAELESLLKTEGVNFSTDIRQIQEFVNLLNNYYDIAPGTSIMGIMKSVVPKSKSDIWQKMFDIIGQDMQASDATAQKGIKNLLNIE